MKYIYKITNKLNGKVYIGQHTWNGEGLDPKYFCSSGNPHFWNAVELYGKDNFIQEIIEIVNDDSINDRESYWINYYEATDPDKGYNLMNSARNFSYCHTKEVREKAINPLKDKYGDSLIQLNNPITKAKSLSTLTEKYGSPTGAMNTDQAKNKSLETRIKKYGKIAVLTDDDRRRQIATRKTKYGKVWSEEAIKKRSIKSSITKKKRFEWFYNDELVYIGNHIWAKRKMNKLNQSWIQGNEVNDHLTSDK